jgi:hypothetical protein
VGGYGNGNGAMPIVRVTHPKSPFVEVAGIHRPSTAQPAQEQFMERLANKVRADQFYTPIERRADGSGIAMLASGRASWDEGVQSSDDIQDVLAGWYRQHTPGLTAEQAAQAGRLDYEAAIVPKVVAAEPDFNAGALLADRAAGSVSIVDSGLAGSGAYDGSKITMKSFFLGAPGHLQLTPETTSMVRSSLTDTALADAQSVLKRPAGDLPAGHAQTLARDAGDGFLQQMRERRDQLVSSGGAFDYAPMDLNDNPLAHVDWLRAQVATATA